jgi:glycosyltransferase involved in cell wall biosynthesis
VTPLISVALPCYNRAKTLPLALASLVAPEFEAWECVLVDDGSTDGSAAVAAALPDARLRLIRLPRNHGRGYARQVALEAARGRYLAKLDADDWLYPNHLGRLLAALAAQPEADLVATSIAVMDDAQRLRGVRGPVAARMVCAPARVQLPWFPLPGLMVRMEPARAARYDPRLRRAEDAAFVLCLLHRQPAYLLPSVSYAYRMEGTGQDRWSWQLLGGYWDSLRVIWQQRRAGKVGVLPALAAGAAKLGLVAGGIAVGAGPWLVQRRSRPALPQEAADFAAAQAVVAATAARLFGDRVAPLSEKER